MIAVSRNIRKDVSIGCRAALLAILGLFVFLYRLPAWASDPLRQQADPSLFRELLVHEVRSKFSHIRIRDRGSLRTPYFVRDSGEEVVETSLDRAAPHLLQVAYTRTMFASFLFKPQQKSCLIVGLGGGAMVRFLNRFFPDVRVDAVEIDPVIVAIARDYFGTKPGPRTRIFTEDAFAYLKRTADRYDAIYMDAFLKPSEFTDVTGAPRHLKTAAFLKSLHNNLQAEGLVVFNLNENFETGADIESIRAAFPSVYIFRVPASGNVVAVGSLARRKVRDTELRKTGAALDKRLKAGFSFNRLVDELSNR